MENKKEQDRKGAQAAQLKKLQDKVRKRFAHLATVETRFLQMEFLKAQAKEICNHLTYLKLTPFKTLYTAQYELVKDPVYMHDHCLMFNEFGEIIPDEERLNSFVLPEKGSDDNPWITREFR